MCRLGFAGDARIAGNAASKAARAILRMTTQEAVVGRLELRLSSLSHVSLSIDLFEFPQRLIDSLLWCSGREAQAFFQSGTIDKPLRNYSVDKCEVFRSTNDELCNGKIVNLWICQRNGLRFAVDKTRTDFRCIYSALPASRETR
jgi:hypothetical protein